jgi:hypothetical protein
MDGLESASGARCARAWNRTTDLETEQRWR